MDAFSQLAQKLVTEHNSALADAAIRHAAEVGALRAVIADLRQQLVEANGEFVTGGKIEIVYPPQSGSLADFAKSLKPDNKSY